MKAEKGNKVYSITENQKKSYQDSGFDIKDDDGKVIAYGRGKSIPFGDYADLKAENEKLQAKIAELEGEKPSGKKTGGKAGE